MSHDEKDARELHGDHLIEALNRLYGESGVIHSNMKPKEFRDEKLSPEEKAEYLFKNGYIDEEKVNRESVIAAIKTADRDSEEEEERLKEAKNANF